MATTRFPAPTDAQITEANWTGLNEHMRDSRRETGCDLSINSGLNLDVATGVVLVDGMRVEITSTETVALTDNSTNRVWVQKDGTVYDNTSITPTAATDFLLGVVTTSGGSITNIYTDYNAISPASANYAWDERKDGHSYLKALNTAQSFQTIRSIALEPGLYWVRAVVYVLGGALSAGQTYFVGVDSDTAAEVDIQMAILNHGDEGANDFSQWVTGGEQVGQTTESNNHPHPVHIIGTVSFADSGNLLIKASTSSHHTVPAGSWVTFNKIA